MRYEIENNPRLKIKSKDLFVSVMNNLNIAPPKHYLEAVKLNSLSYNKYDKKVYLKKKSIN